MKQGQFGHCPWLPSRNRVIRSLNRVLHRMQVTAILSVIPQYAELVANSRLTPTETALLGMHAREFPFEISYEIFDAIDGQMIKYVPGEFVVTFDFRVKFIAMATHSLSRLGGSKVSPQSPANAEKRTMITTNGS